jgi:hypothetical protein
MSEDITCKGMPSTRRERWKINASVDFVASRLPSLRFAPDAQSRAKVMLREAFGPDADSQDELRGWWPKPAEGCWDHPEAWLDAGDVRTWVRKMQWIGTSPLTYWETAWVLFGLPTPLPAYVFVTSGLNGEPFPLFIFAPEPRVPVPAQSARTFEPVCPLIGTPPPGNPFVFAGSWRLVAKDTPAERARRQTPRLREGMGRVFI